MELDEHRAELAGYCYRMLGSGFEAEDAVQETLAKAWRGRDRFDPVRGPLRPWLFRIATNVCLDMLRGGRRRALAADLGPAAEPGASLGEPLPVESWIYPVPDRLLDPAELAVSRETVRLAFVAALQHLPPRQRAVLILRDVLSWSAAEVADLLGASVAAVNSALQRARATLPAGPAGSAGPAGDVDEGLLARYVDAFERYDVETLVALLHEDATSSMPPFGWWLRGRDDIHRVLAAAGAPCEGSRLVRTSANGLPAYGQYLDGEPFALVLVETSGGLISAITTYLDPGLFPLFRLADEFRRAGS
ncbi:sigma-70 family RNA polymerase sigma factor [Nonomuraea sp. SBT364]|uniref:sigma-70 family RNA polymerase sigma factor n=1 Tax=Nonomuraea sp. SBT364 TaxID=1580530 RepID=UPI00066D7ACD|nr:sigma-70 family RNA polymerase sigma factor [Nonomuraea sp. SBT364]